MRKMPSPSGISYAMTVLSEPIEGVIDLAVDLSKGSFQVCAVRPDGTVLYNRALSRARFAALLADQPDCIVAMKACATSHHYGCVAQKHGHEVWLVSAVYVKPFVKLQKNDPC